MSLIKEITNDEIIKYEDINKINIIDELNNLNMDVVIDLIKEGNKCSLDEAFEIFEEEIKNKDLSTVIEKLIDDMRGEHIEIDNTNDVNCNDSFTDILMHTYAELQTLDERLDLNTFLKMSTSFMYKYIDNVQTIYINNKNNKLHDVYFMVLMFMSALAGKLKECPQLNSNKTIQEISVKDKLLGIVGGN